MELLFFPTGGGKTEAYLGLAAYAFAVRRLQGVLTTPDGPLDGGAGVTVLMRYTLRLLTSQQFQRATALVAAAEIARRKDPGTWGSEPFRIGLWVGSAVSPKRVAEAATQLKALKERNAQENAPYPALQTTRCPWCGNPLSYKDVRVDTAAGRVRVYCPDSLASCPFSEGGAVADGIPVLTTDEEIYRLVPAFVIATVDKLGRRPLRARGPALSAPRLRPPAGCAGQLRRRLLQCQELPPRQERHAACPRGPYRPPAPARPHYPGRAPPHYRRPGHHRGPVRGGRGRHDHMEAHRR